MYFEALQIFCDVVRHQSFSRGASANAVSQSAASQAIRQLERRLGAQLIDRSKRPWQLTPEGKLFFQGCQEIIERYHELEDAVQRRQHPSGYTVRVASIYSVPLHDLTGYVDRFQRLVGKACMFKVDKYKIEARAAKDVADAGCSKLSQERTELQIAIAD